LFDLGFLVVRKAQLDPYDCGVVPNGEATLIIKSDSLTSAQITDALGLQPTRTAERSDAVWALDGEPNSDPSDQTGFGSMRNLLSVLAGKAESIDSLRRSCDIVLDWHGFSDSEQGGFVIPADVIRAAAALGCDLFGTVYLDHDPAAEP
jgi:hypothetical protein